METTGTQDTDSGLSKERVTEQSFGYGSEQRGDADRNRDRRYRPGQIRRERDCPLLSSCLTSSSPDLTLPLPHRPGIPAEE